MRSVKLTDFGLSRIMTAKDVVSDSCGTPAYIAPEMLQGGAPYNKQVDVWALGIVFYKMVTKCLPF